ncbi:3-coathanger stack domain-containing protein [Jiulongibacter sediminis]|uniref:HTH LytTR-type domain-containing protein n=1 Tax=Jiulongibacter sediminis TaxID=1605367 RepID=A0A0P7BYP9_9BACT|nr:3-coathanger stack domain-containing protein [Jiulongibacter sediminis]KPM46686.1 hypothetical protein AFM12_18040 [Jiulongibacter sediminis]TBX21591.1 hypothetical protein TK44_18045 [Jiulongibacter sediminis]
MKTEIHLGAGTTRQSQEILQLKASDNYTYIYFTNGEELLSSTNLGKLEKRLSKEDFFRVNRSTIINRHYLHLFEFGNLNPKESNVREIHIPRRKKAEFLAHFPKFKALFTLVFLILAHSSFGQWTANTVGGSSGDYGVNGQIKVTSTAGSVGGDNNYQGLIVNNGNFYDAPTFINQAFDNIPTAKLFKAKAGVPFTITMDVIHKYFPDGFFGQNWSTTHQVFLDYFPGDCWGCQPSDWYNGTIRSLTGKNETPWLFDEDIPMTKNAQYVDTFEVPEYWKSRKSTFSQTYTFPVGRTRAWIVIGFREKSYTVYNQNTYTNLIILPIVVEGPTVAQVDSVGVTTQPQIPTMVIHNPPGDNSSTTITNTGTQCRSFEEKLSVSESKEFAGAYKLGYKGSVGFIVALELETYVEFSASGTEGSFETKYNSKEHCVTVSESLTALSNGKGAQNNDLFVGYGIDLAYGFSRRVNIENGQVSVDTGIVYRPLIETYKDFFLTKQGILDDIASKQIIVDDSLNYTVPQRANAQYQINVWQQVLDKNDANIAAAALQTGTPINFSGGSSQSYNTSVAYNSSQSIEVEHYVDTQFGIETGVYFGGSGFKLGAKFTTNKSFGQTQTKTGGQVSDVSVTRYDDDSGDFFDVRIVEDPVYGTPIFIVDSANSRTSCPYEGGIQRDKPKLEINGSASPNITVSNVSLGNAGNFKVKVCNNSAETRDYGFGFVNESIGSDVFISSTAGTGSSPVGESITKLGTITSIPAGGCKTTIYDVNVARRFANSPMSYPNMEFVTFAECEPDIKSSIFATVNFATPPPPTNVSASTKEICAGNSIQLSGNCPVGVPTWYNDPTGGLELGTGSSLTVSPTSNTSYYLGCVANLYNRDRVGVGEIFVTTPFPTLNLTSDLSFNALQIANTTLTATNKINDPARVKYKAGNSLTFNPGFEAKGGSIFEAEIGGCPN